MRILLLNSVSGGGGGVSSSVLLARGLAAAGHEITVACNKRGELRDRLGRADRMRVIPLRSGPDLDPFAAARIARLIRTSGATIAIADRRKDVKSLVLARAFGPSVPIVHRHGAPSSLRSGISYRFFWQRVAAVVVNSDAMRQRLLGDAPFLDPARLVVIHNAVDTERFRPMPQHRATARAELGFADGDFVVCYHGVLQPRKRVAMLIHAAARVRGARAVRLLIVGDGPERTGLEALAAELDIHAVFTGQRADLAALLAAADASAHLSAAEGFSNSVIEALACGLPVVATAEHSHGEQVEDGRTGLLVTADVDAVAAALARILEDPALLARLGAAARAAAARRFSIRGMVGAYDAVLERSARTAGSAG